MEWSLLYNRDNPPTPEAIAAYIDNPLWDTLSAHLKDTYRSTPAMAYSVCSGAPGWNVKYKKSGRALCTLYPAAGFFTCLVCIGGREAVEAELLLPACTEYLQTLYKNAGSLNGARWLMIDVTAPEILADTKALIALRAQKR